MTPMAHALNTRYIHHEVLTEGRYELSIPLFKQWVRLVP